METKGESVILLASYNGVYKTWSKVGRLRYLIHDILILDSKTLHTAEVELISL